MDLALLQERSMDVPSRQQVPTPSGSTSALTLGSALKGTAMLPSPIGHAALLRSFAAAALTGGAKHVYWYEVRVRTRSLAFSSAIPAGVLRQREAASAVLLAELQDALQQQRTPQTHTHTHTQTRRRQHCRDAAPGATSPDAAKSAECRRISVQ